MLLTKAILKKIPKMYETDGLEKSEMKIHVKLFNPMGNERWYLIEYNPETEVAFCYVTGMIDDELGYVSLNELKNLKLPSGMSIERDRYFDGGKVSLQDVMDGKVI